VNIGKLLLKVLDWIKNYEYWNVIYEHFVWINMLFTCLLILSILMLILRDLKEFFIFFKEILTSIYNNPIDWIKWAWSIYKLVLKYDFFLILLSLVLLIVLGIELKWVYPWLTKVVRKETRAIIIIGSIVLKLIILYVGSYFLGKKFKKEVKQLSAKRKEKNKRDTQDKNREEDKKQG
jgi:hypothetical protein